MEKKNMCESYIHCGINNQMYKEFLWLNSNKINNPTNKKGKDMYRHFCKEDVKMVNKHIQRCSASLIIRKTQAKTTVRYHFIPIRIFKNGKKKVLIRMWRNWKPVFFWEECKHYAVTVERKIKVLQNITDGIPYDLTILLLGIPPPQENEHRDTDICTFLLTATLFITAKWWKQLSCWWMNG